MRLEKAQTDFEKFDSMVGKILSISHQELQHREAKWKKQKADKKSARKK